jgi:nucleotide-binding universal stress UspA family protein
MPMIQNILFPVDFSPSCAAMAPFVRRAASLTSAKVTLLYVVEPSASGFELLVRPQREAEADRKVIAKEELDAFLKAEFPAGKSPRVLVAGDAATRIVKVATRQKFDLIVMPTHAGVFRRMLLGSTTAKVLDGAECPVLTTQHAEKKSSRRIEHREWACAIGLSADSKRVLRYATQAAETFHANLTIVHAIPAHDPAPPIQMDLDERAQAPEREAARRRMEELQSAVGSHCRTSITVGPIAAALTGAARRLKADCLVIGRSPQPGRLGRMRDLTYAVVRDAPCPVLSV